MMVVVNVINFLYTSKIKNITSSDQFYTRQTRNGKDKQTFFHKAKNLNIKLRSPPSH